MSAQEYNLRDSRICGLLARLSESEQDRFLAYLGGQPSRRVTSLLTLAGLLLRHAVRGAGLTRLEAWKGSGFPDPLNENLLNQHLSTLRRQLESFLAAEELRDDPAWEAVFKLQGAARRGWVDKAREAHKEAITAFEQAPLQPNSIVRELMVEEYMTQLASEAPRQGNEPLLQGLLDHLDHFYCLQKIRFACAALVLENVLNTHHEVRLLQPVLAIADQVNTGQSPLLRLYMLAYQMLTEPQTPARFQTFDAALMSEWQRLTPLCAQELYNLGINHCVRRVSAGDLTYGHYLDHLYLHTSVHPALRITMRQDPGQFKNMVQHLLRNGHVAQVEEILLAEATKLDKPEEDPIFQYNKAILEFYQREFASARKRLYLSLDQNPDLYYRIFGRLFSWMCCYELDDFDSREATYHNFRMFVGRNKQLTEARMELYKSFINLLNRLWRITKEAVNQKQKKTKLISLRLDLLSERQTAFIQWLLEKTEVELARLGWKASPT